MGDVHICQCGHLPSSHAVRSGKKSSWKDACGEGGCSCKRYKWDRALKEPKVTKPMPILTTPEYKAVTGEAPEQGKEGQLLTLADIEARAVEKVSTGIKQLDEALQGGFVRNTAILLAGRRGNGKSTIMTVVAGAMAKRGERVLYVSGEEDSAQFAYRAKRLSLSSNLPNLHILDVANLDLIRKYAEGLKPTLIIVDSLQSLHGKNLNGAFVANKRTANYFTHELRGLRKAHGAVLILVGHETKGGDIAGDSSLQHEVDVVMKLDPDEITSAKVLEIDKNRFGEAPATYRFMIRENGIESVTAVPKLNYKAPEILE